MAEPLPALYCRNDWKEEKDIDGIKPLDYSGSAKKKLHTLAIAILSFLPSNAILHAQTAIETINIKARVVNGSSNEGISGALISSVRFGTLALSGDEGWFEIKTIAQDSLRIHCLGYLDTTVLLSAILDRKIPLRTHIEHLSEAVVISDFSPYYYLKKAYAKAQESEVINEQINGIYSEVINEFNLDKEDSARVQMFFVYDPDDPDNLLHCRPETQSHNDSLVFAPRLDIYSFVADCNDPYWPPWFSPRNWEDFKITYEKLSGNYLRIFFTEKKKLFGSAYSGYLVVDSENFSTIQVRYDQTNGGGLLQVNPLFTAVTGLRVVENISTTSLVRLMNNKPYEWKRSTSSLFEKKDGSQFFWTRKSTIQTTNTPLCTEVEQVRLKKTFNLNSKNFNSRFTYAHFVNSIVFRAGFHRANH